MGGVAFGEGEGVRRYMGAGNGAGPLGIKRRVMPGAWNKEAGRPGA